MPNGCAASSDDDRLPGLRAGSAPRFACTRETHSGGRRWHHRDRASSGARSTAPVCVGFPVAGVAALGVSRKRRHPTLLLRIRYGGGSRLLPCKELAYLHSPHRYLHSPHRYLHSPHRYLHSPHRYPALPGSGVWGLAAPRLCTQVSRGRLARSRFARARLASAGSSRSPRTPVRASVWFGTNTTSGRFDHGSLMAACVRCFLSFAP